MPDKKQILFYNAIPMPHSVRLHEALAGAGYSVFFWYYKDLTTLYPWKKLESENEYYVYNREGNNLKKLLRETFKSDLVIITGWHTKIHILLAILCFFKKIKYAYWLDVPAGEWSGISASAKKTLLKMTDFLLVTGGEGIKRIARWNKLDLSKFRDFPYLSAEIAEEEVSEYTYIREKELAKGDKINVLISNRFEKRKGYRCLYEALKTLDFETLSKFRFTIIGSGTEFGYFKNLFDGLKMEVEFRFWVEYSDYLKKIKETDILIHPSSHEPFGIPPIDAMACGKLVISSDGVMSALDRISDNVNGFIFNLDDSARLSEILTFISKDSSVIYKLGKRAYLTSKQFQPGYNISVIDGILNS